MEPKTATEIPAMIMVLMPVPSQTMNRGARRGLGYLIIYGSQVFQLDMVISSILLLCVIAMLLYLLTQSLEHCSKKHRN